MITAVLLIFHLLVPLIMLYWLGFAEAESRREWFARFFFTGSYLLFIEIVGRWAMFSIYLPQLLIVLFVIACYKGYCKNRHKPKKIEGLVLTERDQAMRRIRLASITLLFSASIWSLYGYLPPKTPVQLQFPLNNGLYYAWNGSHVFSLNFCPLNHFGEHGVDLVKLNGLGSRANAWFGNELSDYVIYGEVVHSPCDGTVRKRMDGQQDLLHSSASKDPGNFVSIDCLGVTVVLAHFLDGSVRVEEGQIVKAGDFIGLVGSSGSAREPYLHIHAERGGDGGGTPFTGENVPIRFEGRYLVRNSLLLQTDLP